jgi:hypothetical protein
MLGEPSRNVMIECVQKKYDITLFSNTSRSVSMKEIEDTIQEIFPIGSELIIRMLEAEVGRIGR